MSYIQKIVNQKRLRRGSNPSLGEADRKTKRKRKPVVEWFIKKITFARKKSPRNEDVPPNVPSPDNGGEEEREGAASI